jgi:hypothetical protein
VSGFKAIRAGVVAAVLASSFMLSACNDETSSVASGSQGTTPATSVSTTPVSATPAVAVSTTPATNNNAGRTTTLALTGTAASSVTAGNAFSFAPTLSGASGAVGYSIQNKPVWATFNTATGSLTGTPSAANVGTYANIVINATDAAGGTAALAAFSVTVAQVGSSGGTATLSWNPPTQNTDGSVIATLAGYRIYYGTSPDALTKSVTVTNPGLTAYTLADLGSGTYYFGISAYTTGGVESGMSTVGSKTIS